jgi:hypothetical protein
VPNFEVYKRQDSRRGWWRDPTVTVMKRGLLSLSPAAMRALEEPAAIRFLVDRDARMLGLGRAEPGEKNAMRVRITGSGQHFVSAIPVLAYLEADLSESRRYPLLMIDGTHCIDLKEPGTPVTSNRRKKESRAATNRAGGG